MEEVRDDRWFDRMLVLVLWVEERGARWLVNMVLLWDDTRLDRLYLNKADRSTSVRGL